MNTAFQSYTPRVIPLNYDALESEIGCQPISGTRALTLQPFVRFCSFEHGATGEAVFNQPDTVSYFMGPTEPNGDLPFRQGWAAWVSEAGIRVGKYSSITPPDPISGEPSSLYPSDVPPKVSGSFDAEGRLALAIQKTGARSEVKWYTSDIGNSSSVLFPGKSAALWFTGMALSSFEDDLAVIYLKQETPFAIYARFQRDEFGLEYILHGALPQNLSRIISVETQDFQCVVHAIDDRGFDCTLTSAPYGIALEKDSSTLGITVSSGLYTETGVPTEDTSDSGLLSVSIPEGSYFDAVASAGTADDDKTTLSVAIIDGAYTA